MKLTLPMPPSINHYWRRHGHIVHVSAEGKKFAKDVAALIGIGGPKLAGRINLSVTLHYGSRRTIDLDNRLKPLCDALTKAGVWEDDSQIDDLRIVRGPVDKANPRIEIEITEV